MGLGQRQALVLRVRVGHPFNAIEENEQKLDTSWRVVNAIDIEIIVNTIE